MRTGALAMLATAGVLLAASLFFGGASSDGPVAWIGAGAVLAAAAFCGAALWGASQVARDLSEGVVVMIFPDGGDRYLSGGLYSF